MRIQMKTVARGPEFSADPGDVRDVAPDFARALIKAGSAVAVEEPAPEAPSVEVEEAVEEPTPETALAPEGRRKGRR